MLDPARDDQELAGLQLDRPVTELDPEAALPDQEHLLGLGVAVPGKDPLHLHQPDVLAVQPRRHARPPVVGEGRELLGEVDGLAQSRAFQLST